MDPVEEYDVIVVGSGFGGSMAAHELVGAGQRVLMLERGDWVPRGPHNSDPSGSLILTPYYSKEIPYRVSHGVKMLGRREPCLGLYACVGGPSVFYGAVSLRLRERDFEAAADGASRAAWPFAYAELEPYYGRAEALLGVAGESGRDPTEPHRSLAYPQRPGPLSGVSRLIERASLELGLRPFRLPLAINHSAGPERAACVHCGTCDTYACPIGAKNDLATVILPRLIRQGLTLRHNSVVLRLVRSGERIVAAECFDKRAGATRSYAARAFVLAAGGIATPHLLLASGLDRASPAGDAIGRYLARHCSGIVMGAFPRLPDGPHGFHKQLGFHDYYYGDASAAAPEVPLGGIQQLPAPPVGLMNARLRLRADAALRLVARHAAGLLVMAPDEARAENRLTLDGPTGPYGLPRAVITHRYSERDLAARRALVLKAKRLLRKAGAWFCYVSEIDTFSHVSGTVRMGVDPRTAPLDAEGRLRGLRNLYVTDASALPSVGAVNPSLTIAANALRVGAWLARDCAGGA